jgi:hypothetical protein
MDEIGKRFAWKSGSEKLIIAGLHRQAIPPCNRQSIF